MLCDKCKKTTATYHYKQNVNGQITELHLCPSCAAESAHSRMGTGEPFGGIASLLSGALRGHAEPARRVCSLCGATSAEIAKSAYAGCSECYRTFAQMFSPYIAKLHGHVAHRGRVPLSAKKPEAPVNEAEKQLTKLKKELDEAIREENFEKAAVLRDQINALKQDGKA